MKTGLIGLGAMGAGMARNVAKAGFLTGVYNRTAAKARKLAEELNVTLYDRPEELAVAVDIVLICVSADGDVLDIIHTIAPALKAGTIVVDMSTVSSSTAESAAAILAEHRIAFLDAPVSGGVEGANNGTLAMMAGGPVDALEKVMPVFESICNRIVHMGANGSGQAVKAVNQILCAGINEAVTEALAFAETQGLPMEKVIEVISGGAAGNWFLDRRGLTMTRGNYTPGFKLALHHKDLKICQAMANRAGFPLPLTDAAVSKYQRLMEHGFGDEDISALYRLKKPGSSLTSGD
ncbi:MAG: NAD(P)-dependent oxidoreductase [Gammaproteobacteria bacterium]